LRRGIRQVTEATLPAGAENAALVVARLVAAAHLAETVFAAITAADLIKSPPR
jgi:hypothetical protein